jgi:hypothetical protein
MSNEAFNARAGETVNPAAEPYLRLARHFENVAGTYR